MTGRSWRHFSVFWAFMVAGALGPAEEDGSKSSSEDDNVAPASSNLAAHDPMSDSGSDYDFTTQSEGDEAPTGHGKPTATTDCLPGPGVVDTDDYDNAFQDMPLHDAMLDLFCQAARLGGELFGDNVADTAAMSDEQISAMEEHAATFAVDGLQIIYGHVHTTKVHQLVQHLGDELRGRGNLWEGDTSENEKLHSSCKRMFRRTNKRGPTVALQMMRCDEAQSAVLRGVHDSDAAASSRTASADTAAASSDDEDTAPATPAQSTAQLLFTGRGDRVHVGGLAEDPALRQLPAVLDLEADDYVTVHNTVRIIARFEWGAPGVLQHLRAARSFMGKPWFSFVRYEGLDGEVYWGRLRLVLRAVARDRRSCVVLQRMRRVNARPACVLTRYGCIRLGWDFAASSDAYPALELVDATRVLRAEDVQVDWFDLSDRLGLFATPGNETNTVGERRAARYFTNPFFPWTTRSMHPGF